MAQGIDVFDLPRCNCCNNVLGHCTCGGVFRAENYIKNEDKLKQMFQLREKFMRAIKEKRGAYGEWPVDLGEKKSQQMIREVLLKGVEECFEALNEFKNHKNHRVTEDRYVDREKFLEEMVDAFNFFFAGLILAGIDANELFAAYVKKDAVIHERLNNGY